MGILGHMILTYNKLTKGVVHNEVRVLGSGNHAKLVTLSVL